MDAEVYGKILYIGGFELPDKNAAAQRVLSIAKIFREIGYETIFLGVDKNIECNTTLESTRFEYDGFIMYTLQYPKSIRQWKQYLTDAKSYIAFIKQINNLKAIICYNLQSIVLNRIRKYCCNSKIKCIADVTEWYSGLGRALPIKILKGLDTFYRMRIVQKKMDGLIVISRYLENYYSACDNVVYIPPLTNFDFVADSKKLIDSNKEIRLVYAGNPGLKDQINLLIEALPQVKRKAHLDIIGINKSDYLALHPEHKGKHVLTSNIVFHGRLPHTETVNYIRDADFSCFFRYDNRVTRAGFPTKFSEAISLGTPVITNKSSNLGEYIRYGVNGILLEKLSIEKIASAIENAADSITVEQQTFNYLNYIDNVKSLINVNQVYSKQK